MNQCDARASPGKLETASSLFLSLFKRTGSGRAPPAGDADCHLSTINNTVRPNPFRSSGFSEGIHAAGLGREYARGTAWVLGTGRRPYTGKQSSLFLGVCNVDKATRNSQAAI